MYESKLYTVKYPPTVPSLSQQLQKNLVFAFSMVEI